jgi:acyl-CoA thioesterase-1
MSRVMVFLWAVLGMLAAPALSVMPTPAPAADAAPVILVFGDSISAGYGINVEHGWVQRLAQKISEEGYGFRVVNASVSGETTTGGLARLPRALASAQPRIVLLELGGNDGLRGLPIRDARANLERMIMLARAAGAQPVLIGMRMPPNYGERYTSEFQAVYRDLAMKYGVPLVPFLLEKVAGNPALMQADGIHPTEAAQSLLLATVWPTVAPLLRSSAAHRAQGRMRSTARAEATEG